MTSLTLLSGDGGDLHHANVQEGHMTTGDGYNAYGAQELDAMGLPAMLLEEAPHPATLDGKRHKLYNKVSYYAITARCRYGAIHHII